MLPPFVSADWLDEHRDDVVVADTRWYLDGRSGRDAYLEGHLPGAVFVDLDRWLSGPSRGDGGRHPLPAPGIFAEGMSQLGIGDDVTVVAYDDAGGVIAARLVWMLRVIGRRAAVLDGGITAYRDQLETALPTVDPARFSVTPWPAGRLAGIDDVGGQAAVVVDARNRDRFRGEYEPVDPRAGHIPGAINLPCRDNVGPDGRLVDRGEIRRSYQDAGVFDTSDVIAYCGSGVTACHTLLTLELTGFGHARLYPGSWSEYSRTDRPVEVGR
jgi:thiosulfate/3-mercaptopyruvate sulfurtransferase